MIGFVNIKMYVYLKTYRETARGGWVGLYTPPLYTPNTYKTLDEGDQTIEEFIIRAPILDGKNGYYRHLMKV